MNSIKKRKRGRQPLNISKEEMADRKRKQNVIYQRAKRERLYALNRQNRVISGSEWDKCTQVLSNVLLNENLSIDIKDKLLDVHNILTNLPHK